MPLLGWLVLHCTHPMTWGALFPRPPTSQGPFLWFPPAGIGLALVAWLGPRGALLAALSGLTVALQMAFVGTFAGIGPGLNLAALLHDGVAAAGLVVAWRLYHHTAAGARGLGDPRSAILFLFLVGGLGAALVGLGQALLAGSATEGLTPLVGRMVAEGLAWALGVLALTPPLLVMLTPCLERRALAIPEPAHCRGQREAVAALGPSCGDWVEIAGLTLGTTAFSCFALLQGQHELLGWHLWGAPLLLIVWASMRQGLPGGTISAAAATTVPVLVLVFLPASPTLAMLLRANLLTQCSTAVLVAASITWIRAGESRYRQVISHIPVVLYSARLRPAEGRGPQGEVTLVSAASADLLGCPPDQLLGPLEHWLEHVQPHDREVLLAAVAQLQRQVQPVTCEYRIQKPPNTDQQTAEAPSAVSYRWVRDTLAPLLDVDGRLLGWEGVLSDVTEQRLLADDLRRTSSMLNGLVSNLPTGVFFVQGRHGQPLLVNARARALLGREDMAAGLEQLPEVYRLFRADGSVYPAEELPVWQALRHQRTSMRDDVVVHRPDGRRIPLITWAAPVALPTGPAAVWVLEDLTALHQAEAARRDTEGRLRTVIATMAEGLLVQDRRGAVVEANPTACSLLGHEVERLRGKTLFELGRTFLREDRTPLPADEHPTHVALRHGRPVRHFVLGIAPISNGEGGIGNGRHDGPAAIPHAVRWVLTNAMPLGTGKNVSGVVTTYADVTAHVEAQKLLRASEEKYRGLIEALPVGLVQADRAMHVTYTNQAWTEMTGYEVAEVAEPALWSVLIHPEDLPRVEALASEGLAGRSSRAELRYRAKDGSEKVVFALTQPRWQDGAILGTTTLVLDLTRERRLQQELQGAQRLELVGRLTSGIAHDFNNLLTVILSLTDLAREALPADHAVHGDLRGITEAAEQAANLAKQLLAFGKQRHTAPQPVAVNAVVRRTLALLRASLPSNVHAGADLASSELFIEGDETQLQQVLMNLCLNARDAMPQGGRMEVRTRLEETAGQAWVRLTVEDGGVGMNEYTRAHLFEPFFSTKERGTGLGLAVVQQIVESFGGRVEVVSQPGQGARFDVWWPAAPAAAPACAADGS
jgi:PAS domain S-box-containing protein